MGRHHHTTWRSVSDDQIVDILTHMNEEPVRDAVRRTGIAAQTVRRIRCGHYFRDIAPELPRQSTAGPRPANRKLTDEAIADIVARTFTGEPTKETARRHGISQAYVADIQKGKYHSSVAPQLPRRAPKWIKR